MPAPPTRLYTLSLHDSLPISHEAARLVTVLSPAAWPAVPASPGAAGPRGPGPARAAASLVTCGLGSRLRLPVDRKSTRLNSSHPSTSYAVCCLKKKTCRLKHV